MPKTFRYILFVKGIFYNLVISRIIIFTYFKSFSRGKNWGFIKEEW